MVQVTERARPKQRERTSDQRAFRRTTRIDPHLGLAAGSVPPVNGDQIARRVDVQAAWINVQETSRGNAPSSAARKVRQGCDSRVVITGRPTVAIIVHHDAVDAAKIRVLEIVSATAM